MSEYKISQLTESEIVNDNDELEIVIDTDSVPKSRKMKRSTLVDGLASEAALGSHEADTANPHEVTAAQVGAPTTAELTAHTGSVSNPHSVTKSQVGLSNVDNTADASKPVSTATQTALDTKASASSLNTHTADTANPHAVTKAQVGLSNVPNTDATARANHTGTQAISTVTGLQTALDGKADDTDIPAMIVESVVAGTNVTVDNTDPANPVVSASGGGGGGAVDSVNTQTGDVVLDADDIDDTSTTHKFATATQLANADSATQPGDLATVATSGDYDDLSNKPTLGTAAAAATGDFATAAQGATADTAVQPADIADFETTTELNARDTANRDRTNHTGSQAQSTITDLVTDLADKADDDAVVHDTGDETVAGVKTFSSFPVMPSSDPTTDYQAATKKYVDANAGGGGGGGSIDYAKTLMYHAEPESASGRVTTALSGSASMNQGIQMTTSASEVGSRVQIQNFSSLPAVSDFWDGTVTARFTTRAFPNVSSVILRMPFGGTYTTNGKGIGLLSSSYASTAVDFFNSDGTSQTTTDIVSSISTTNPNRQEFVFVHTAGVNVKCYLNGSLLATHTTNVAAGAPIDSGWMNGVYLAGDSVARTMILGTMSLIVERP